MFFFIWNNVNYMQIEVAIFNLSLLSHFSQPFYKLWSLFLSWHSNFMQLKITFESHNHCSVQRIAEISKKYIDRLKHVVEFWLKSLFNSIKNIRINAKAIKSLYFNTIFLMNWTRAQNHSTNYCFCSPYVTYVQRIIYIIRNQ